MSVKRFFLHAPNIYQGGGFVLLQELLAAITTDMQVILHADARLELPNTLLANITVLRFKPTLFGRLAAEFSLLKNTRKNDVVLCFNGLPPLFKNKAKVFLFIQNRYLLGKLSYKGLSAWAKCRIFFERLWIKVKYKNAHELIVQTPTMLNLARKCFANDILIKKNNFIPVLSAVSEKPDVAAEYDFLYVASPDVHKNHKRLLEAWRLLAEKNIYPHLCLTINPLYAPELMNEIKFLQDKYNARITNTGTLTYRQICKLYQNTKALIFPSLFESLGLPLLEAKQIELPIVAAELDYVRDIVEPVQTFDPHSAVSIARAVERFLQIKQSLPITMSATEFLNGLLN